MRPVNLIFLTLLFSIALTHNDAGESTGEVQEKMPTTLAEAHAELERFLSTELLAKIDAAKSEDAMVKFHRGLGRAIRNKWCLWGESPLSKHMQGLGFTHADDMSAAILKTFWCKRHGKPFRLKERAAKYSAFWESVRKNEEKEKRRVEAAKLKMRSMIMGLRLNTKGLSSVKMPDRFGGSLRARFLAPYHGGVFIAVRKRLRLGSDEFHIEPYFFSSEDRTIHKVHVPELRNFNSVVIA